MKAMIFAAGLGTRLKPWTDHHPKALAVVNGKSLLQRNIEYLQLHGITEVIVNVHHFADQVVHTVEQNKGWGSTVAFSDETDAVLETGGGLKKAGWYFKGEKDFVVMNTDILTDMDLSAMIQRHQQKQPLATLAVSDRESSRYFLFDDDGLLRGWRNVKTGEEKPASIISAKDYHNFRPKAFSGIHVIHTKLFGLLRQEGKFSMVEVYLNLMTSHRIMAFDHTGTEFIDVGKPENIRKAELVFTL
jgi:NDP-sugar pyrophosphorylase family protein